MVEKIDGVINAISGVLYQPYIVPLFLLVAGVYFTVRTGLLQISLFGESIKVVSEKPKEKGSVSSFGALMVSTASRVGTGNIIGVASAIVLGGPGAIFWMWITAILGGASAFIESTLAQIYKRKDKDGTSYGGPSYYMQDGLKQRWLGVIFAIVLILTYAVGYNMLAAYNTQSTFGGFTGSCIMWGIKRGLYSNEAGMGSAPNAAASAEVAHPAKQGLVQMLSVFIDTLLICTATAFMCLCGQLRSGGINSAAYINADGSANAANFVQDSIFASLGAAGPIFIAAALTLFAFTTLLGNYYYCEGCLRFILKRKPSKAFITCFRIVATVLVFVGAILSAGVVWNTADMLQGIMVVINVPVILILGGRAIAALKDYKKQRKEGKSPEFKSADIGLSGKTDCWE